MLKELAAAIVGMNGRCDHTTDGALDLAICFGIGLYIIKHAPEQIKYHGNDEEPKLPFQALKELANISKKGPSKPAYLVAPQWR